MKKLLIALALVLALSGAALAAVPEPDEDLFWILDQAKVLTDDTVAEIFYANQRLYDASGAEIVVVTTNDTGKAGIQNYTKELFNEWDISPQQHTGVLLVMEIKSSPDDGDYWMMAGTELQNTLDAATIDDLTQDYLEPDFAKGRYDAGVQKWFEATYDFVADVTGADVDIADAKADYEAWLAEEEAAARQTQTTTTGTETGAPAVVRTSSEGGISIMPLIVVVAILLILFLLLRSRRRTSVPRSGPGVTIINTPGTPYVQPRTRRSLFGPRIRTPRAPQTPIYPQQPMGGLFGGGQPSNRVTQPRPGVGSSPFSAGSSSRTAPPSSRTTTPSTSRTPSTPRTSSSSSSSRSSLGSAVRSAGSSFTRSFSGSARRSSGGGLGGRATRGGGSGRSARR